MVMVRLECILLRVSHGSSFCSKQPAYCSSDDAFQHVYDVAMLDDTKYLVIYDVTTSGKHVPEHVAAKLCDQRAAYFLIFTTLAAARRDAISPGTQKDQAVARKRE